MEPARLRKLLDQVCNAIASSLTPTSQYTHVLNRDGLGVRSPLDGCSGGRSLIMLVGSPRWHHKSFGAIALYKSPSTICQHHGLTRIRVCPYSC
jgi:hypothetical protein